MRLIMKIRPFCKQRFPQPGKWEGCLGLLKRDEFHRAEQFISLEGTQASMGTVCKRSRNWESAR